MPQHIFKIGRITRVERPLKCLRVSLADTKIRLFILYLCSIHFHALYCYYRNDDACQTHLFPY